MTHLSTDTSTTGRRRLVVPRPAVLWAIAGAWALAIAAEVTGSGAALHHDGLIRSSLPLWGAMLLALLAWQVMVAAMMLPSSLPLIRLFGHAAASQPQPWVANAAFLGGYAAVWTAFGAFAFGGDVVVHKMVEAAPWLEDRQWLIPGSTFLLAGAFQFSSLKDACLKACRHPSAYILKYYRRGIGAAFRTGARHGLFCLGCCWALMLLMFSFGVANLAWMAPLTALMVYEKVGVGGERVVRPVGYAFLSVGLVTLLAGVLG